ncbi:hypothetical protein S83_023896, partial [Arachis hypogaea]
ILHVLTTLALMSPLEMAMLRFLLPLKLQGRQVKDDFRVLLMPCGSFTGYL